MADRAVLQVTWMTHQGKTRVRHEDAIVVERSVRSISMERPEQIRVAVIAPVVCAIADGMGGQPGGREAGFRVAARLALAAPAVESEAGLRACLDACNEDLYEAAARTPGLAGMGTTVAGVLVTPEQIFCFNVGDSRIYRVEGGFLRQLSVDDTAVLPRTVSELGEEIDTAPRRGPLIQSLGGTTRPTRIAPHVSAEPIRGRRKYLLCSDGLSNDVSPSQLEACLAEADELAVASMVELALEAGGHDNISVILLGFGEVRPIEQGDHVRAD